MSQREACVELRGLRLLGVHGALAEEAERPQPFELDVDATYDAAAAAQRDDLSSAVDYGDLVAAATAVVQGTRRFVLLESLAEAVAEALLSTDRRLAAVEVVVRKLRPPVAADLASAGVRLTRRR